jgi:hypothetical protein
VPSDHIQDYSQSTLFLCVLLRAYQHSCWYQLVSDWQFQPRGVVSDIASLQVPRIPWREELLVLHTWRMRKKELKSAIHQRHWYPCPSNQALLRLQKSCHLKMLREKFVNIYDWNCTDY